MPNLLKKINKALGLPKKSEKLWDILSISDINTKVEENMVDIAENAKNTNEITSLNERVDQLEECCDCTKCRKFRLSNLRNH